MIYRNEISKINHFSLNPMINKHRHQKYKAHVHKIAQISNRIYKPQIEAKIIQNQIQKLTQLKSFSRHFKNKQHQLKRTQNDRFMIQNITLRSKTTFFTNPKSNKSNSESKKSKSTIKLFTKKCTPQQSSLKKIKSKQLPQLIRIQNQRLVKSISQKSFDEQKYRKQLRQETQNYQKIRSHMRRIKAERHSEKKLKTEPTQLDHNNYFTQETIQKMNDQQAMQIYKKFNKITNSLHQLKITNKNDQQKETAIIKFKEKQNDSIQKRKGKKKNIFAVRQQLVKQIEKRLTCK